MTDAWAGRTFTNAPPLMLPGDARAEANRALTAEWKAAQAVILTPEQETAVHRWAHHAIFGTDPTADGSPIDWRNAFAGGKA
jgi:hypothetical protein